MERKGPPSSRPAESQKEVEQWMIDTMPDVLVQRIAEKGIEEKDIRIAVRADMNVDHVHCDNWLLATDTDLICIGGTKILYPRKKTHLFDPKKLAVSFGEISYDYYPLSELSEFKVEEMISINRLIAQRKSEDEPENNGPIQITYLTNATKNHLIQFARALNDFKEKGKVLADAGQKEELFCPKCGQRYADPKRKICPRCMDKGRIIRRTSVFFLKYNWHMAGIVFTLVLSSALGILSPYISSGFYYDEVLNVAGEFYGQLLLVLGIIIATRFLSLLIQIFSGIITSSIAAHITYDLKKVIFGAIERLSISFFTGRQTNSVSSSIYR